MPTFKRLQTSVGKQFVLDPILIKSYSDFIYVVELLIIIKNHFKIEIKDQVSS